METFVATLVSGLVLGSLYALMASGLSVVWTTLGVFNFAHGAFIHRFHFHGGFVGFNLGDDIAGGHAVAFIDQPFGECSFFHGR